MKRAHVFLIAIVCGLLAFEPAYGASKKKPTPAPDHNPVIASVTATSITITEGKTAKTLGITSFTEIMVNGQKATAAELKPGMIANVTLGTDPTKASRIVATGK